MKDNTPFTEPGHGICVYSSSSDAVPPVFFETARELGELIGERKYTMVYGGAGIGLMGQLARSVHERGGRVVGVITRYLNQYGITYEKADELIITDGMRERKTIMEERAGAFIALPGGFGTLEELLEVITLKQLQLHTKAIVMLNTDNFYGGLIQQFEEMYENKFAKPQKRKLYTVVSTPGEALEYIENYQPEELEKKWF